MKRRRRSPAKVVHQIREKQIRIAPAFKLVFSAAFLFTLLSFLGGIGLSLWAPQTPAVTDWIGTLSTTWKMGFAGVFGLIGGKALP